MQQEEEEASLLLVKSMEVTISVVGAPSPGALSA